MRAILSEYVIPALWRHLLAAKGNAFTLVGMTWQESGFRCPQWVKTLGHPAFTYAVWPQNFHSA